MKLSKRIENIKPSATLDITGRAKELQAAGKDIITLSAGEPDFNAPDTARQAGIKAIQEGFTHYTAVAGIAPLRERICERLRLDFSLSYTPEQIIVSCGAKAVLFHLFFVLLDPGDEVIIPKPYWVSYPDQVILAEGKPVFLATLESRGFVPDPVELEKAITPKTKILVLNFPSNPSGAVVEREQLQAIARVVKKNPNMIVISDEIYAHLVYDGFKQESIAAVAPEIKDQCVIVNGMSKAYAMTGWRIGYAAGPTWLIKALNKMQGQSTSNASSIAQRASLGALKGDQAVIQTMLSQFEKRRDVMHAALSAIPNVECLKARGAFDLFPNFKAYLNRATPNGDKVRDSGDLANYLLNEAGVALVPGEPFGAPENLRISFAASLSDIEKGIERIAAAVKKLK